MRGSHFLRGRGRLDGPSERDRSPGEVVLVVAPIGATRLDDGVRDARHSRRDSGVRHALPIRVQRARREIELATHAAARQCVPQTRRRSAAQS